MLTAKYNEETKTVTLNADLGVLRTMGIAFTIGIGGVALCNEVLQGVVSAADNTSNDEDFHEQLDSFFDHVREEHAPHEKQKEVVEILRAMVMPIPRSAVMVEHFRHLGQSEQDTFNA